MWWQRTLKRLRKALASRGSPKARRRPTARPWLEPLEDRFCPAISATWNPTVGNAWDNPANWDGNVVPGAADEAIFDPAHNTNVLSPTLGLTIAKLTIHDGYSA